MKKLQLLFFLTLSLSVVFRATAANSIARVWDERALAAIRIDRPHPPAQARNLFSVSVCMWDAWAAYDTNAVGYVYRGKHTSTNLLADRNKAISYAAWRMLKERHAYSITPPPSGPITASVSLAADDALMATLGYDTNYALRVTTDPAGVGNLVYDAVSAWFINDGARQTNGIPYPVTTSPVAYPDYPVGQGGYVYVNRELASIYPGIRDSNNIAIVNLDVNHWQRLWIPNATNQSGQAEGSLQGYLGAQWLGVRPFALTRDDPTKPWIDPGPPPFFGTATHTQFVNEVVAVIAAGSQLTPDDGATIDISPGAYGNNSLDYAGDYGNGTANFHIYDGQGYVTNPVTGQPYAPNVVKRGDFARVLAEFWADGPSSETPPGHWNVLANYIADHPLTVKTIGGVGTNVVDDLEWDVKVYFALNAAVHEAACACWAAKRAYGGWRPISAIRYLAGLGQSSDTNQPSYNANGLPLIPGLIQVVTAEMHATNSSLTVGKIAILGWPGAPASPASQHSGVVWMHGESYVPYQRASFVTPAFPGFFSGHSTFSRAAAEVLAAITGSPYFPGGMGSSSNYVLGFENGPSVPITLQWATYYDAADQAGISRIWGGIHPPIDNLAGRKVGAQVGKGVWALVKRYWDGSVTNTPITITRLNPSQYEVRYTALRGFYYDLQSTLDLNQTFTNDPPGTSQPFDALSVARTNTFNEPKKFFRAISRLVP